MPLERRHLTTAEVVALKAQLGTPFVVNPDNLPRITPDQVTCPCCQHPMTLERVPVTVRLSNCNHRATCVRCELVITLWNRWLDDHFIA